MEIKGRVFYCDRRFVGDRAVDLRSLCLIAARKSPFSLAAPMR